MGQFNGPVYLPWLFGVGALLLGVSLVVFAFAFKSVWLRTWFISATESLCKVGFSCLTEKNQFLKRKSRKYDEIKKQEVTQIRNF